MGSNVDADGDLKISRPEDEKKPRLLKELRDLVDVAKKQPEMPLQQYVGYWNVVNMAKDIDLTGDETIDECEATEDALKKLEFDDFKGLVKAVDGAADKPPNGVAETSELIQFLIAKKFSSI